MPRKHSGPTLLDILRKHPKILRVLHHHGIHFCPGCYLTLSANPRKAAAFHAVPDIPKFIKDLARVIKTK